MLTSMDDLVSAMPGQLLQFYKPSVTAKAAGTFQSLWTAAGAPGAGTTPPTGVGQACDNTTTGALKFSNPTGGDYSYLARALLNNGTLGTLFVYDRLVHTSGLSGTVSGSQTVNTTALTRYTNGEGVMPWIEFYTPTGSTAVNITITYTNTAGDSKTSTSTSFIVTPVAGQLLPIPLADGDTGVQSVQTVVLSASTGTAGNFGVTLMRRLTSASIQPSSATVMDAFATGLQKVEDSACLALAAYVSTTSTGALIGELSLVQG